MKATAALAFFLCVALGLFVAGFLSASALMAKPASEALANINAPDLWPAAPKAVAAADRTLERVPAAQTASLQPSESLAVAEVPAQAEPAIDADGNASAEIDQTQPGAGDAHMALADTAQPIQSAEHQAWCAQRYRSYNPADNSYNAYSGERKDCVSPYMDVASSDDTGFADAAESGGQLVTMDDHARRCQQRYSSYRPSDDTYQPFGGPRRLCTLN